MGYPDGGSKYKLHFEQLCKNFRITHFITGAWNPQVNGVAEQIHQVLGNCLINSMNTHPWDEFLAATIIAIRSTIHTTLGTSPAQLVFGRDMILQIQYKAEWVLITQKK